jgi:hypothetical protein
VVWRDDGGGRGDGNRGHLADVRVMPASAERPRERGRKPHAGATSSLLRDGESGETNQI